AKLSGTFAGGRAQLTAEQGAVGRVKDGQSEFNEITASDIGATLESSAGKGLLDGQWKFSIGQTQARSGVIEEVQITNASASNLSGTIAGGRAQITSGQATVERAEARLGVFNEITLRDISATLASGASEARGHISLRDGSWDKIKFGRTTGRFTANRNEISLNDFNASALGGGAGGDLTVGLSPNGISKLRAEFTGARAVELFSLLGVRNDHLEGAVTGRADVTWPGTNLRLISGDISARFDGRTTSTPDVIPVRGEIVAKAQSGVFYFDQFTLRTDTSTLAATGKLALDGDSDLRFSLTSTRAEEFETILNSSGLVAGQVERLLKTYEPHLFGDFSFTGTLTGRLDNPTIAGDLQASSFGLRDEILGALKGRVVVSPSELRFEQGSLTTSDTNGVGSVTINYASPLDAAATGGRLDITFERIALDMMLSAMGLPTRQKLVTGEVSGEAHLTGLPAAPSGEASLNLSNGVIAGQHAESATAMIEFDGQTARIERVEARLPQGRFTASGAVNLQTNEYQFQGQAEQLGLQRIAEAFELGAARISGVADATFQVSGDFDNPEDLKIEMTAQARQVTVNGREAGPVTLTARTTPDGRVDVELTTSVAGRPQPLIASIEWRRSGRPIEIRANLENFDISPILSVYAPEIARSVAGQVSGTLRVAGPLVNARGEATVAGLRGALLLTNVSLEVSGTPVSVSTPLEITIGDSQIRIESARITAQGTDLRLGGSLAITENAPIDFSIEGQVNLNAFDRPDDGIAFDGEAVVNARIGGVFNDPRLTGEAILRNISVSSPAAPITMEEGSGRITLSGDRLTLENFSARAGDGVVRINGAVTTARFKPGEWRFDIIADDADVLWRGIRATADAKLTLTGTPQAQQLSGAVTIPQGDFTSDFSLTELGGSGRLRIGGAGGGGITARGGAFPPVSLDIRVEAFDSFVIRNNQINTIASAALNITGTLEDPDVIGRVTFEGGAVTFHGRRYDITVGTLDLPGGTAEEPRLQVLAESNISGYRVYVGFNGPTGSLNVTLRSEPDLPRAEIISLITTGRADAAAQIGADPALSGLSTAASLFSEEFLSKPLGRETQRILGINRFQIEPVLRPYTNPAARLTIGRQIAHGLT
ncbi:MAG: translocation/assembly module TamB domain-containing protein, partial [Blastocatellia bacterium]